MEWLYSCKTEECPAGEYDAISQFYLSIQQAENHKPDCPYCEKQLTKILNGAPIVSTGWVGSAGDRRRAATSTSVEGAPKKNLITLDELLALCESERSSE